ncbi:MAG: glycosyltransferase family 61 protein [Bacteroidia bacterium]|nr:glycosyltransferase family 61 protein [Bacteroidia bacterium]
MNLRTFILSKLPWRVQGFLGGRPQKTISIHAFEKQLVYSGTLSFFSKPITLDKEFHQNFTENFCFPSNPIYLCKLKEARVFRNNGIFSVINNSDELIAELSTDPLKRALHPIYTEAFLPLPVRLKGRVLMLATLGADWVYFHWLIDFLPKLVVIEEAGYSYNDFSHIIVNPFTFPLQKESLERMGVPLEKIVFLEEGHHYLADELLISTEIKHNPSTNKLLKRHLQKKSNASPTNRVFISRKGSKWRNVVNEKELEKLLEKYNFTIVENEKMNLNEQIECFNNANLILSTHGANLTNIFFCTPGTKVIEIIADWHHCVDYWILSNNNQLDYFHVPSQSQPSFEELNYRVTQNYNLIVDIELLERQILRAINEIERENLSVGN